MSSACGTETWNCHRCLNHFTIDFRIVPSFSDLNNKTHAMPSTFPPSPLLEAIRASPLATEKTGESAQPGFHRLQRIRPHKRADEVVVAVRNATSRGLNTHSSSTYAHMARSPARAPMAAGRKNYILLSKTHRNRSQVGPRILQLHPAC